MTYLFSLFPIFHLAFGIFFLVAPESSFESDTGPTEQGEVFFARAFGGVFVFIAGSIILCGFAFATCLIIAGRRIVQRRSRLFCQIMAGIQCAFFPFHTILGVFTLVVLTKPEISVKFDRPQPAGPDSTGLGQ